MTIIALGVCASALGALWCARQRYAQHAKAFTAAASADLAPTAAAPPALPPAAAAELIDVDPLDVYYYLESHKPKIA